MRLRIPTIKYGERRLSNGLQLLSIEDHASPTVAVQVWYKVGSKDDPQGRSGFAHLFEHLMFKRTRHLQDEMMDRLTEDVGGYNNASTGDDFTSYYEVSEAAFVSEREVVKEEFRQRILAPPYGRLFYLVEQLSFTKHPYKRPGIGSIKDLEKASIQDVRAFHADFYRPDNATLIVAGDFDQARLDSWVDAYFGSIRRPRRPMPRVNIIEPAREGERRFEEYGPTVPLPAVVLNYLVPPIASKDAPALRIAQGVLSNGESSRLYRNLVYERQLAQEVFAEADLREDAGLFLLGAILASGKGTGAVERALIDQIRTLHEHPVGHEELEKVKSQIITQELRDRQTSSGKAFALGQAAVLLGRPEQANTTIDDLCRVSAAEVQHVIRHYCSENNRVVLVYLPESMQPRTKYGAVGRTKRQ
jgi:zinc protease